MVPDGINGVCVIVVTHDISCISFSTHNTTSLPYAELYTYSRIPLIWHSGDQSDAKLSNILNYQAVIILTQVLTGIFFLLLVYFGYTSNQRRIPFGYLIQLLFQRCQGLLLLFLKSS